MTETLDVIRRRYACRQYADRPLEAETLRTIAAAGLAAPSALNRQPWRIITVSDRDRLADLETVGLAVIKDQDPAFYERLQARDGRLLYGAPALVVIAQEQVESPWPAALDVGIVASHIALAATSLGVDNVIAALPSYAFNSAEGPRLKQRFGIPAGFEFAVSILLGYAAGEPRAPHQPDLAKLIEIG
ncbi:MAG: nitroreductase family protein [Propionibacteriaceae bacterium]|jgi:nitroreductase|nr:nitroreductase family protein [Propionibacteriaceae bacterium]